MLSQFVLRASRGPCRITNSGVVVFVFESGYWFVLVLLQREMIMQEEVGGKDERYVQLVRALIRHSRVSGLS